MRFIGKIIVPKKADSLFTCQFYYRSCDVVEMTVAFDGKEDNVGVEVFYEFFEFFSVPTAEFPKDISDKRKYFRVLRTFSAS